MQVTIATEDIFQQPRTIGRDEPLKTVIVRDNYGNPIFVAIQQDNDNIWAMTADNPKFNDIVYELGILSRAEVAGTLTVGAEGD